MDVYKKLFDIEDVIDGNKNLNKIKAIQHIMDVFNFNDEHRYYVRQSYKKIVSGQFCDKSRATLTDIL